MDEEDVNLKRVYAHQNAELDKRACVFFLSLLRILFFFLSGLCFSRKHKKKLNKKPCSYFFFFFFFFFFHLHHRHQIYKG